MVDAGNRNHALLHFLQCGVNANLAAYYADSSKPDGTA